MSRNRIHIPDHLILPFGAARKTELQRIKLTSVAANGIYLTSEVPCLYIDRSKKEPLTMQDFRVLLPDSGSRPEPSQEDDVITILDFIHRLIREHMPADTTTRFETTFLALYFGFLQLFKDHATGTGVEPLQLCNALLPVPQMQLYVHDPLEDDWTGFEPTNNFRVDFGFWTGTRLIAVEIDGKDPEGYARDIRRDRLLRRAQVDVIHILNTEIERHGDRVISSILPNEITYDWRTLPIPDWPFLLF